MRLVLLLVVTAVTAGCSSPAIVDQGPDSGRRDTAVSEDTSTPAPDTPDTTPLPDTTPPPDTATADTFDSGPDTADTATPTDTAPTVTWITPFPQKPDDVAPDWYGELAALKQNDTVTGSRAMPTTTTFKRWSATLKIDSTALTCPAARVTFGLRWNCTGGTSCEGVSGGPVDVPRGSGAWTTTVTGTMSPTPRAMPGQPAPRVFVTLGQYGSPAGADCGRLFVWPATVTFEGE